MICYADITNLKSDILEIPVQINGTVKYKINVVADADEKQIEEVAINDEKFKIYSNGKEIKKVIVIKSKIVNIVLG